MSTGEGSRVEPNYRNRFNEHTEQLSNLIEQTGKEMKEFEKWAAVEDDAAFFTSHFCSNLQAIVDSVNSNMRALETPGSPPGYPSHDESVSGESSSAMSSGTIIYHKNGPSELTTGRIAVNVEDERPSAFSSWKGKEKEVNPPERVADTEAPSKRKGKEPEIPYHIPFTGSTGESSHTRLDDSDSFTALRNDILLHHIALHKKWMEFYSNWGSEDEGKLFLNDIARTMESSVEEIRKLIGHIPHADNSLTLDSDRGATPNRYTRTLESRNVSSQDGGEATTRDENSSESKLPQCKIIIPARRPRQLPPRAMRKSKKLLDYFQFDSDVGDELEGEVKEEEESPRIESISQALRPAEGRRRYNLRSDSRKKNVAGPSRTNDEPVRARNKEPLKPQASKRVNRKRQVEDEEESSHKNKKRRREDEVKKREIKKETLNKKRKRDDDNVNEEAKTRKRTRRN